MIADHRSEFRLTPGSSASNFPAILAERTMRPLGRPGSRTDELTEQRSRSGPVIGSQTVCCIRASGGAPAKRHVGEAAHVLFEIAGSRRLSLPDLACPYAGVVYLGHRILANSSDLRSHVQRIILLVEKGDVPDLQGALVDLFIALGDKGCALKQRLLNLAAPRLSLTVKAYLRQRLAAGINPWEADVANLRTSLLSLGFSGAYEVVRRRNRARAADYANAVEEARSCLEYGQVDAAREVLERALLLEPGNDVLAAELLEIYRYTRDDERRAATRQFLLAALPELPASWREESSASSSLSQFSTTTYCGVLPTDEQSRS